MVDSLLCLYTQCFYCRNALKRAFRRQDRDHVVAGIEVKETQNVTRGIEATEQDLQDDTSNMELPERRRNRIATISSKVIVV